MLKPIIEVLGLSCWQGAPYAYTPFCDNNKDMDGFRFWRQGFWKNHLRGKPYHISALYVVDLARFRWGAISRAWLLGRRQECRMRSVPAGEFSAYYRLGCMFYHWRFQTITSQAACISRSSPPAEPAQAWDCCVGLEVVLLESDAHSMNDNTSESDVEVQPCLNDS